MVFWFDTRSMAAVWSGPQTPFGVKSSRAAPKDCAAESIYPMISFSVLDGRITAAVLSASGL